MKKRILACLLSLCMIIGFVPTAAFAINGSVLTTSIDGEELVVGVAKEFKFEVTANDHAGEMVVGTSVFSDPSAIEKLEYKAGGAWFDMAHDGDGKFGPATGFPMTDAESEFHVTFKKAGDYSFTVKMEKADGSEVLCETEAEFSVREPKNAELTTSIDGEELVVGVAKEFNFEVKANDDAGEMVVGTSVFSDPSAIEKLEYKAGGVWSDMAHDGDGKFGPATGFPVSDATSEFRVTFKKAGDYSFTVKLEKADGSEVLCETEAEFSVREYKNAELTTSIDGEELVVGVAKEFNFEVKANDDAGEMVVGTSVFSDPSAIEKLEYKAGGAWFDMAHDGDGKFGPATGFPVSDAISEFRVTFKKAGDYSFTVKLEKADGSEVLCETEAEFSVREYKNAELTTDITSFVVGKAKEFTFTTTANDDAGIMVVGLSNFSDPSAIEKLEYYEKINGQWYELSGEFGPETGFPMTDATSKFRVTFKKAGDYSFTAKMVKVEDGETLCETDVDFTVRKKSKKPTTTETAPSRTNPNTGVHF